MKFVIDRVSSGRYRLRGLNAEGRLAPIDMFDTREEAEAVRDVLRAEVEGRRRSMRSPTVGSWVRDWAAKRVENDRRRAEQHIVGDAIAALTLKQLRRRDVREFRSRLATRRAMGRGEGRVVVEQDRGLTTKTQREIFVLLRMALDDAVDAELIRSNPARELKLPPKGETKAFGYLYPDEDARLMQCERVPFAYRVAYGFLHREGMRKSEALATTWSDLDLERGIVALDENKSDDPRAWALGDDVVRTLKAWRAERADTRPGDRVFIGAMGEPLNTLRSHRYRTHLRWAGVDRPELFVSTAARNAIRIHDTRATFVTLALAAGRTETWVTDRTGHTSSVMLRRYKRMSRTAREVGIGWLEPLDALLGKEDPQEDPRRHFAALSLRNRGSSTERNTGLEGVSRSANAGEIATVFGSRGSSVDLRDLPARWARAVVAERHEEAARLAHEIAEACGPVIDRCAELRRRVLDGGPHAHRDLVELLRLLLPDAATRAAEEVAS